MLQTKDKKRINFTSQGEGIPALLIHGLAASLNDWEDWLDPLASSGYAAYAIDLLGHGESHKPAEFEAYTVQAVYEHFADWVDLLALDRPAVLIGHSLGGYLALLHALRHPSSVLALVLIDPFYSLDQLHFLLRLNYLQPSMNGFLVEMMPEWMIRVGIDLSSISIKNGYSLTESVRAQTAADYKRAAPGVFNIPHSVADLTPSLSGISQPALVLWGSRDRTLRPESFPRLVDALPNARGESIDGAAHVPHQSHPRETVGKTLQFLSGLGIQRTR